VLSSEFVVSGDSATPATPLTRREARALESPPATVTADFFEIAASRPTTDPLPVLRSEPRFAFTPGPVVPPPSRRDTRPIGRNGKRLTDRQIAKQRKSLARRQRPTPSRPRTRDQRRPRIGQRILSLGAMLFAGALLVGMSVPANAFMSRTIAAPGSDQPVNELPAQSLRVDRDAAATSASRDSFSVLSWAEVLTLQYGTRSYEYTVGTGTVRWPFPFASPISDGYGERVAPCYGCSTFHNGVDFTPGGGAPIYAIADGVVRYAEISDYGFGNHVYIVHTIDGQQVESLYAHMQMNSSPLRAGDVVHVGDFVGLVGETGTATGNHLHFELKVNGSYVDPFAWLTANAN
jgi:murein DD-endopeptidase MepM/ murein hydrolase activator NlpD